MSPEKQRIAIQKVTGVIGDPLNDLNAMHEAENTLNSLFKIGEYIKHLSFICQDSYMGSCGATAAQRAEAFLRTLNLWEEE